MQSKHDALKLENNMKIKILSRRNPEALEKAFIDWRIEQNSANLDIFMHDMKLTSADCIHTLLILYRECARPIEATKQGGVPDLNKPLYHDTTTFDVDFRR